MLSKIKYNNTFPINLIPNEYHHLQYLFPENSILYFSGNKIYGKKNNTNFIIYQNKIIYCKLKIPIKIKNKLFFKNLDSFDQNNIKIKKYIRNKVIQLLQNSYNQFIGIGGEFYVYYPFTSHSNYISFSNCDSIIQDAIFNSNNYKINSINNLVNYKDFNYTLTKKSDVLINLFTIPLSVYNFINNNKKYINKLIIVACKNIKIEKINMKINSIDRYNFNNNVVIYSFI